MTNVPSAPLAAPLAAPLGATLFDFNGVLVDDEHVHLEAFRDALAPEGLAVSDEAYWDRYIGFDDVGAFRAILADSGRVEADGAPSPALVRALVERKKPLYLARAKAELKTFPGAAELLRRRASLGPVAVVSGALRQEIELGLSVLGVRELVVAIVAAEDTPESKPDPMGYRMGIAELVRAGVSPELAARALVIEDSAAGISAAKAAGLPVVAVEHSTPRERLLAAGADRVVPTIVDVTDALVDELLSSLP